MLFWHNPKGRCLLVKVSIEIVIPTNTGIDILQSFNPEISGVGIKNNN